MKKSHYSVSFLYFVSALFVIFFIVVPFFVWSYYDTKEQTQKNLNSYFMQSSSIVQTALENKVDTLKTILDTMFNSLSGDVQSKLQKLQNNNFDILFYKSNEGEILNYSDSFLYDTEKIVDQIVQKKGFEFQYIQNVQVNKTVFTLVLNYKKVISNKTGRVKGIVVAGEILNNNFSFINSIVKKTSLKNIALKFDNSIIATNVNKTSKNYKSFFKTLPEKRYVELDDVLVFKKNLIIKLQKTQNDIVFIDNNMIIKSLQKNFIEKNLFMIFLIVIVFFIGYMLTKKYIINPIKKLKEFDNFKRELPQTIVKDINYIANELYETLYSLDEYKKAIDISSIVSKSDAKGTITYVNDLFCEVTGYTKEEILGKSHNILRDKNVPGSLFKNMWHTIKDQKSVYEGYLSNKKKNGELFYTKVTITPILDKNGNIVEFLALREDVTDLIKSQKQLENAYTTDNLTKLSNRYQLTMDLDENEQYNLILINIDAFSEINDFYGNEVGDKILMLFSKKIQNYFTGDQYKLYRVYGDEFAVTLKNETLDIEGLLFAVHIFINHIEGTAFMVDDISVNLRITCGIGLVHRTDTFIHADIALKSARKDKKDCEIYSNNNSVSKEHKNNLYWTHEIKAALAEDRIETFYQPIRNNITGEILKFETLVRLITKNNEVISPFFFLEISKKTKLYTQITKVVIEKSFNFFYNTPYSFSINLTLDDILNPEIIGYLKDQLKKYNYKQKVVLEIVESEQIENFEVISNFIEEFKSLGCSIAIDDFGTGYSNFEYLMKLNVDYIKIDGSLIKNIVNDKNSYSVVETIVDFAKKSHLKVIAEFVSSKEIQSIIKKLDIEYSQGYYFGKPEKTIEVP